MFWKKQRLHAEVEQVSAGLRYLQAIEAWPPPVPTASPLYCNKNILWICELGVECRVRAERVMETKTVLQVTGRAKAPRQMHARTVVMTKVSVGHDELSGSVGGGFFILYYTALCNLI